MKTHGIAALLATMLLGSIFAAPITPPPTAIAMAQHNSENAVVETNELSLAYHSETGKVRFLSVPTDQPLERTDRNILQASVTETARGFLGEYGRLFGLTNAQTDLRVMREQTAANRHYVRFQQTHHEVPVFGGELIVQLNQRKQLLSIQGEVLPDLQIDTQASINSDQALQEAILLVGAYYQADPASIETSEPELWIYNPALLGGPGIQRDSLVWRIEAYGAGPKQVFRELILVNAHTGIIDLHFNQIAHAKNRHICDGDNNVAQSAEVLSACDKAKHISRAEGQAATGNQEVDIAYQYVGDTYDFYHTHFGRDSFDNKGATILTVVNYCPHAQICPYQGAFWDGRQIVLGSGFGSADDVVGHEITHAVTENTSGLIYYHESGALNESLSDVFGEFIDLSNGAGDDSAEKRWSLGEDTPPGQKRNMANPPIKGHPDRMGSPLYLRESLEDNGGVHTNSGVGNKAAYLITDGGTFNGQTIQGIGQTKAQQLYYHVASTMLTTASNYADLGSSLIAACHTLLGSHGLIAQDCEQVRKAVSATEMLAELKPNPKAQAFVCLADLPIQTIFFDDMENPSSANWHSQALNGIDAWFYPNPSSQFDTFGTFATSGTKAMWGYAHGGIAGNPRTASNYVMSTSKPITISEHTFVHFQHAYAFETHKALYGEEIKYYDGGIFEYSTDNGQTWHDAATLNSENGYNGIINGDNKLGGSTNILYQRAAFVGQSSGYISSRYDLEPLKGQQAHFRFHIAVDNSIGSYGWQIDDFRVYTCDTSSLQHHIFSPLIYR